MTIGLTIGKFMPPHKGHELMIDFGANLFDRVVVLVSGQETDEIPLSERVQWLKDHYIGTNVRIVAIIDDIPIGEVDEYGTCIDDDFWEKWIAKITKMLPHSFKDISGVVTSDRYGERLAKELGVKWWPVDPNREAIYVCSTDIREEPEDYENFIMEEAKEWYRKSNKLSVVVIGPESTGKTTMVHYLAGYFGSIPILEYGRVISEIRGKDLTEEDFSDIVRGQIALTRALEKKQFITIQDTELLTTYLFGKVYLGKELDYIKKKANYQHFDLYILLAPTVGWEDDGTRIMPDDNARWNFFYEMKDLLKEQGKDYVIIDDTNYDNRFLVARHSIEGLNE